MDSVDPGELAGVLQRTLKHFFPLNGGMVGKAAGPT